MLDTVESRPIGSEALGKTARRADIFQSWWLQSFGYVLAALYLVYFIILYRAGSWIVGKTGLPIYTDFGFFWEAGLEALHRNTAALYNPEELIKLQAAFFEPSNFLYRDWVYPPSVLLLLAPLALLPYPLAFIAWDVLTLLGCVVVVHRIVRRRAAIALALAAPFTAWSFLAAQNGFLTAGLLGASLLALERRPALAGVFIGCLTYKPQFGILFPIALVASRQWRAIASAMITTACVAVASFALLGAESWAAFPGKLATQAGVNLLADPDSNWGYLQTVYGLIRTLHGSAERAWIAQGATTLGVAIIVWLVWRSRASYPLKAATLSAGALIATPYAFAYDMAAIVIPAAFIAKDQLQRGLVRGEKAMWIVLFGVPLAVLVTLGDNASGPTFGGTPVSLFAVMLLPVMILRRIVRVRETGIAT